MAHHHSIDNSPSSDAELEEFQFDDEPESRPRALQDEEYDAINDETFGCTKDDVVADGDLGAWSERSKMLEFFEESIQPQSDWNTGKGLKSIHSDAEATPINFSAWVDEEFAKPSTSKFDSPLEERIVPQAGFEVVSNYEFLNFNDNQPGTANWSERPPPLPPKFMTEEMLLQPKRAPLETFDPVSNIFATLRVNSGNNAPDGTRNQEYGTGMPMNSHVMNDVTSAKYNGHHAAAPPSSMQRLANCPSVSDSTTSLSSSKTNKRGFLPSTKTISDFAFDPYAGLMSKKEREWLIKIQLIQCMGTGEKVDDDYYYTLWKERNVLAKAPAEWNVKMKPKYYNFDDTYPSDRYIPPVFNGSLGRPTHASTSFPRQVIDLRNESLDDDESTTGQANTKKLRGLLMRIENASLALLECKDALYKLRHEANPSIRAEITKRVLTRTHELITALSTPEELPVLMIIQKGRVLISQLIQHADEFDTVRLLSIAVENLPRYAQRIPTSRENMTLFRSIISKSRLLSPPSYIKFRQSMSFAPFESSITSSEFARQLCLTLLIALFGRGMPLTELAACPFGSVLAEKTAMPPVFLDILNQDAVDYDLLQLYQGLSFFHPGSLASEMAKILHSRIGHRPT